MPHQHEPEKKKDHFVSAGLRKILERRNAMSNVIPKKCGCAYPNAYHCITDQIVHRTIDLSDGVPERCDCICHDRPKADQPKLDLVSVAKSFFPGLEP